jgi:hypothetical protein
MEGSDEDQTMSQMGIESNDHSWWALDINPQFPTFNSQDLTFDTTAYGLQNEQSLFSSSSPTDCQFNQDALPRFNPQNLSFDTPSAFGFEEFSRPSSNPFSVSSMVAPAVYASPPTSRFLGASQASFMQFQPTQAPAPFFPHTGALPANASLSNASSPVISGNASPQPTTTPAPAPAFRHTGALLANASPSSAPTATIVSGSAPQHVQSAVASFMQFQPTQAPAPFFPHTGALPANSSLSNASSPVISGNATPQPTTTPAPAPAFRHTGALPANASPSHAPTPTIVPGSAPQHIQPAVAPSDASSPPPTQNTVPFQQIAAAAQPEAVHTVGKNGTMPELTETSAINQADGRRSGRNPVPSKRHEQMNEIGKGNNKTTASCSAPIEKENFPPSTIPKWTIASHDHLLISDLGKEWTACVQAWFELEKELGFGSQAGAKVCLLIFFSFELNIRFKFV